MKKFLSIICCLIISSLSFSQEAALEKVTNWKISLEKVAVSNESNAILIEFDVADHWYTYGNITTCDEEVHFWAPTSNIFKVVKAEGVDVLSEVMVPVKFIDYADEFFKCSFQKIKGHAIYRVPIKIKDVEELSLNVNVEFGACTEGLCLFWSHPQAFSSKVKKRTEPINPVDFPDTSESSISEEGSTEGVAVIKPIPTTNSDSSVSACPCADEIKSTIAEALRNQESGNIPGYGCDIIRKPGYEDIKTIAFDSEKKEGSLWDHLWFMLLAFVGGLTALLTPCVFPMIPMTVSFFTKQAESKSKGLSLAVIYGLFIILIYTLSGTILAKAIGASGANLISTHWIPNLIFFVIFLVFALSFLGLFEITLPSSIINASDKKADKGGLIGVFFMAFTLVLVSFSCTGPIVSSILIESADGSWVRPLAGMLGFSLAFALPFTLFAIFPSALQKLPKSGGWLNSVKVVLGLIELALAFKFLSQVDLFLGLSLLDREVFLAIWIAIFLIIGLYLLGRVKMKSDDDSNKIGVFRMIFAISSFVFVVYLIPGMWGAPLKAMSGLLPPMYTQDFVLGEAANADNSICVDEPMYSNEKSLHWPHGINGYFDLREAICCAYQQDKPIFLDFTGHTCANCRKMEMQVWSDPAVLNKISQDFIPLAMYGDGFQVDLPKGEQYVNIQGDTVRNMEQYNREFLLERFKKAGQPFYLLLEVDREAYARGEIILKELVPTHDYDLDTEEYVEFLKQGTLTYYSR